VGNDLNGDAALVHMPQAALVHIGHVVAKIGAHEFFTGLDEACREH
jgi:hypothetical protein